MTRPGWRPFFREALLGDERLVGSPRVRFGLAFAVGLFALVESAMALLRHATFHGRTFDLAFYARMAWGAPRLDGWNPIVNASVHGLHLVWIDYPLGVLALVFGAVPVLAVTQALAVGLAALPLARIGARHLGPSGAAVGAVAFLLHPNLSHVAGLDFHPGSFAVLPIACLMDALDRRSWRGLVVATAGVLLCREDLALVTLVAALVLARRVRADRIALRAALGVAGFSVVYVLVFTLVLLPLFGPSTGSLDAHFGHWGASVPAVVLHLVTHPGELLAHLSEPARLAYLPTIAAPLALLPFLAPELLVVAAPVLAICLLSQFPTTLFLDSHYLTPAVPVLVASALVGAARLRKHVDARAAVVLSALVAHTVAGADPLALRFDPRAYAADRDTAILADVVRAVGPDASIQAPDRVLAHFAERVDVRRAPPPEQMTEYVLLDTAHRRRFLHDEDVLRADEETLVRDWLAREDHELVLGNDAFVLFRRGVPARASPTFRRYVTPGSDLRGMRLTACLELVAAELGERLELELVARGPCPSDLALRIGVGYRPRRVDFVANGQISPAHLRDGDRIVSAHTITDAERAAIAEHGLRLGALRESGARPEHDDPPAIDVPLEP